MLHTSNALADKELRLATFHRNFEKVATRQILIEAYKRLNIKIVFITLPAERSLWAVNNGIVDGEASRMVGLDKIYSNLQMVKIPVEFISMYVYTKDVHFTVQGWQSVKPYRIAYQRGVKVVEQNLNGLPIESLATIDQAFVMLEHNRVDVVIADAFQAANLLPKYPAIKMLTPAIDSFPVYHYLHKKHADLVPKLETVLQQMTADKTIERINREFAVYH